jgi:Skp family chaperone for outer membrane proteins
MILILFWLHFEKKSKQAFPLMNKFLTTICIVLTACGVAQAQKAPKVATVDVDRVVRQYQKAIDQQRILTSDVESARQKLTAEEQQLQAYGAEVKRAQTDAENSLLSEQGRASARKTFEEKARDFQDRVNKFNQSRQQTESILRARVEQNTRNLLEDIRPVVNAIAKEKSVDLVLGSTFNPNSVLFADASLDITDEVLKRLNDAYSTLPLTTPPPAAPAAATAAPAATTPVPAATPVPAPAPAPATKP